MAKLQTFRKLLLNTKGLTLVEILGAIVILGMIFTAFFTFFSQSMLFSSKVENKLTSVNLAERMLYETEEYFQINKEDIPLGEELHGSSIGLGKDEYIINNKKYYPIITITQPLQEEQDWGLYRVHIQIYAEEVNEEEKPVSELFGYIEIE